MTAATDAAAVVARAQTLLPDVRLGAATALRSSERTTVLRVATDDGTVVVKEASSLTGLEGWLRESAALLAYGSTGPAAAGRGPAAGLLPRLLAHDALVLVLGDLGGGPSVADRLLGADPAAATDAVLAWATAVGTLASRTRGTAPVLAAALARQAAAAGVETPATDFMPDEMAKAARDLPRHLARLGLERDDAAAAELLTVADLLPGTGPCSALSPGDTCPDNNVLTGEGLVLLDLEGGSVRHAAWDGAYLLSPWPTCWCAWQLPAEVARRALAVWRTRCGLPVTEADLAVAQLAWVWETLGGTIDDALGDDPPPRDPRVVRPTRRQMLGHALANAPDVPALPALSAVTRRAATAAQGLWGLADLPLAPAYR